MVPFSYRRPGQRGRPAKVWISAKVLDFRAAAEAVLGELTMFERVAEASAPPDVPPPAPEPTPEPAPEPVAPPVPPWRQPRPPLQSPPLSSPPPPVLPPVLGRLCIVQADNIALLPIAPPPASEPLPPLPEPDLGTVDFWNEHPFFRPPDWTVPWARTTQEAGSIEEDLGHG
jgi:hypothetical protein